MPRGKTTTKLCSICLKDVSLFAFNRHFKSHDKPAKSVFKPKNCSFCKKLYENSSAFNNHVRRCPANPNRKMEVLSDSGRELMKLANLNRIWSEEQRINHSISMKKAVKNNPDSYSKNNVCGRVKIIEYSGVKLKGSWEVILAKWLDANDIKWENEVNPQPYWWNKSFHTYFPDFYLPEYNVYIEVKGYKVDRDEAKWSSFKNTLVIVDKNNIHKLEKYDIIELINKYKYVPIV